MKIELTDDERELIIESLYFKKNLLETGDPNISAEDAKNMKEDKMLRALSKEQMRLILSVFDLIDKLGDS